MSGAASPEGWGRRRAVFTGNVQGVGFRYRTLHVAHSFAVVGFVRNLADGTVELVVEGQVVELDRFVAAVRSEMDSYIDHVALESPPSNSEFHRFEIRS